MTKFVHGELTRTAHREKKPEPKTEELIDRFTDYP
jgi:hypothetical protein